MPKFKKPGFTMIPNEIFDDLMKTLSGAQFKVLCLISRRTLGYHRECHSMSLAAIAEGAGLSEQGVVNAVKDLESGSFIECDRNFLGEGGRRSASTYRLSIEDDEYPNHLGVAESATPKPVGDSTPQPVEHSIPQPVGNFKEEIKNLKETDKENTYSTTGSEPSETDFESSVEDLVRNMYRTCRGAKLPNLRTKTARAPGGVLTRFQEAEESLGRESFERALRGFLAADADYLKQAGWAPGMFLKNPGQWDNSDRPWRAAPIETPAPRVELLETITVPELIADIAANSRVRILSFPERWNNLVPSLPVTWSDSKDGVLLRDALKDGDFTGNFEKICEKARAVIEGGGDWLTFRTLLSKHKDSQQAHWWRLLQGQYDGMAKAKTQAAPAKGGDDWKEKYRRR